MFDQRERLTAVLEYDMSFGETWTMVKDMNFALLEPVHTTAGGSVRIQP
jgi:molybdenum-dependent DNA-binding transcriptional regulator ModE